MPRELFSPPDLHTPRRSKWTIAGSILAHLGLVFALLVLPVLSAFDTFVVRANNSLSFTLPVVAMPVAPPPPSAEAPKLAPDIKRDAAPLSPPEKEVTREVIAPPPGVIGVIGAPDGVVGPGSTPFANGKDPLVAPPPPAATSTGPVRPGGDIKFPTRTKYVEPRYPEIARTAKIDGTVILEATIDANGIVRDLKVLKSVPFLDDAAKAAVMQWQYTPTKLNGVAMPILLTVTVTFQLK